MGSVVETVMDVLIQEAGSRVVNISCQLSIVALPSPSVHCFSVKREPKVLLLFADTDVTQEVLSVGK